LDVWVYDHRFSRLPSVTEQDFENYVNRAILENAAVEKFGRNDEPLVMRDIIAKYTQEEPSSLPTYITFINDGGVKKGANEAGDSVQKLIIESAAKPLFWQFVGIGNADFGVLKKLDTIEGRFVDNANFFQIDNIDTISNAALYDLLLNEFPLWLEEAKQKGVLA
ncbi:VWA domain-containing protein, partial [Mesorhizobium sp. M00.F.Ca.ET.186.01.1.1]